MQALRFLALLAAAPCAFGQARLLGFEDRAIDDSGKIKSIEIAARIQVAAAGTYSLAFDLVARNGNGTVGRAQARLETGTRTLTAKLDTDDIRNYLAQDGPYRISDVRLSVNTQDGDAAIADSAGSGGTTRAYRLADLYKNPYSFTGEITTEGIERRPSGKFGALRVHLGVVTAGGKCALLGTLRDENGRFGEFENSVAAQQLSAGKSTLSLDFNGANIADRGVDGPLLVSGVRLDCDGHSVSETTRFRTANLRASDFDNPAPDFEFIIPNKSLIAASNDVVDPKDSHPFHRRPAQGRA